MTIIFLKASQKELLCLRAHLETFAQSTGLRVNYAKTGMVSINLSPEKVEVMAGTFGCRIQSMPFTYLGFSMGSTKPRVEHFAPLINRAERQLPSIASMLTYASKLQLVNSVLSSLPTFTMCSIDVPVAVLEYFNRARRNCMWHNSDINAKKQAYGCMEKMLKTKKERGLGYYQPQKPKQCSTLKAHGQVLQQKGCPMG
jgi:hypothetical protein